MPAEVWEAQALEFSFLKLDFPLNVIILVFCDSIVRMYYLQKSQQYSAILIHTLTNITEDDAIFCGSHFHIGLDITEVTRRQDNRLWLLY